ncbi:hypothetical protein [Tardiphaga robiniae]|uniref:Uncharacterized protein n=1 Tax=Tardiphaga robiniae TaxID=943830 RepID=A0A7G6TUL9_9BRAD|nr:hypothetical protein [Tardiphaga robiniae]QND70451.1 hypothetical protein HB776_03720 [Tardiphaga robiniae]
MEPVLACVAGVLLGLRVNVLALVPTAIATATAYLAVNVLSGRSLLFDLSGLAIMIASTQAGYFVGLTGRDVYGGLVHRLTHGDTKRV